VKNDGSWQQDNIAPVRCHDSNFTLLDTGYYILVFITFLYICANPFVYASKFDPVRRILLDLIPCKKSQQADG